MYVRSSHIRITIASYIRLIYVLHFSFQASAGGLAESLSIAT